MACVHSFALRGKIGVSPYIFSQSSYCYPSLADATVLSRQRNSPLVFNAAGECILNLYTDDDMKQRAQRVKGKRQAPSATAHARKKRRLANSDDDDETQPQVRKNLADRSMEG